MCAYLLLDFAIWLMPSLFLRREVKWGRPPLTCFSFDEPLGGILVPPTVISAFGWAYVTHETSQHSGERKLKPGLQATMHNATLRLSTQAVGEQDFSVGYLGMRQSKAVVRLRCVDGCECAEFRLQPSAKKLPGDRTVTTDFTSSHEAKAPLDGRSCMLELVVESHGGERFKLVALHVRSRGST